MVSQPRQGPIPPGSAQEKDVSKKIFSIYIAPLRPKTHKRLEDTELNEARSKPNTVNRPVRTARKESSIYIEVESFLEECVHYCLPATLNNGTPQ